MRRSLTPEQPRSLVLPLGLVGLFLALSGCTNNSPPVPVFPAQGELFVAGQPAAGATVIFYLKGDKPPAYPSAAVEPDGSFHLTSFAAGDGAPEGEYAVTVIWAPTVHRDGETWTSPDKLKGRYSNPAKTTLHATVQRGNNRLPRFDLK